MVLLHKAHARGAFPSSGEVREFASRSLTAESRELAGKKIYIFCDDSAEGAKDGGLFARGQVVEANEASEAWRLSVRFDGASVHVPLFNYQLDAFKRHPRNDPTRHPILTDIGEIRRRTTNAPVHEVPDDCGAWLDIYHFWQRG